MKYKVGDKVKLKSGEEFDKACENLSIFGYVGDVPVNPLSYLAGQVVTITDTEDGGYYHIDGDPLSYCLDDNCFDGLAEECEGSSPDKYMSMTQWAEETDGDRRPLEDVLEEKVSELEHKVSILECRLSELEAKARAGELC